MDIEFFIETVERMRSAQVEYFRTRSREVLQESKILERQVDATIRAYRQDNSGQVSLGFEHG